MRFIIGTLQDSLGQNTSIKTLKSKSTLIDFWFVGCEPCRNAFPRLDSLYTSTKRNELSMIMISIDEGEWRHRLKAYLKQNEWPWENYLDVKLETSGRYGINSFPTQVLVDQSFKILAINPGWEELSKWLKKVE